VSAVRSRPTPRFKGRRNAAFFCALPLSLLFKFVQIIVFMRTALIDKQINTYLGQLNPKEKQAVLSVVRTFVENKQDDGFSEDKEFIAELDRRTAEYESGKAKVLTLDQLEARARKSYKAKAKK
jgi:putative addiction module component (TIGR02574 family)